VAHRSRRRCRLHAVVELLERSSRALQQRFARGIEDDATTLPLEELESELLFETANLLAHRAVREMQDLGGRAEVLQLADHSKRRQSV
jgi:hypothetical protein